MVSPLVTVFPIFSKSSVARHRTLPKNSNRMHCTGPLYLSMHESFPILVIVLS